MCRNTSQLSSMIVTVPIESPIALANDDADRSSVTSPPNLRTHARYSAPRTADRRHGPLLRREGVHVLVVRVRAHPV